MLQASTTPDSAGISDIADAEATLIRQAGQGQQAAFRKLYDRYLPMVYGLCLRLTGNRHLAEEATQEVFIQVWRKIDGFRGDSSFGTWLHSVGSNTTLSYLRRQNSWLKRFNANADYEELVQQVEDDPSTDTGDLMHWLPKLPERARLVFVLHGIEGYRQEQVAKAMGISVGTVKAQYHKASHQLREWLGGAAGEQP